MVERLDVSPRFEKAARRRSGRCGGPRSQRTRAFADRWRIPQAYTDTNVLLDQRIDAVIIASVNDGHHPLTIAALDRGLDVLCEKPLGRSETETLEMATAAARHDAITMVPFTYRYMPLNRWVKELIDTGYLGRPRHLSLRYFADYARDGSYLPLGQVARHGDSTTPKRDRVSSAISAPTGSI